MVIYFLRENVRFEFQMVIFLLIRDPIGIIPLYIGYGVDGSVWFSSEMKALQANCSHYESFPPGHYYTGKISFG